MYADGSAERGEEHVRARIACKNCNKRRVRCDRRTDGGACSSCRLHEVACELIESKRGKHKRKSHANNQAATSQHVYTSTESVQNTSPATSMQSPLSQKGNGARYVSPSITDLVFDRDPGSGPPTGRVVYMGDSNNMKYLCQEVGDPFKDAGHSKLWGDNLQASLMERLGQSSLSALGRLRAASNEYLKSIGALDPLEPSVSEELIDTFVEQAYPFFPVLDIKDLQKPINERRISPLVLNALYCVAAIHCPHELIQKMGFESRYLACSMFYQRAKALHEADYDTDGIANVQACTLLMNWWGAPMEQKDTWHWLGVATNLAQALGMHRSKSYAILPDERRKLWRRIWWVLFINDIHHAAVFGRGPHIHSQYCDIEPLTIEDIPASTPIVSEADERNMFLVEMCHLSILVDKCLLAKFTATATTATIQKVYEELVDCSLSFLLSSTRSNISLTIDRGFYPSVLQLIHLDYIIVMGRMLAPAVSTSDTTADAPFKHAGAIGRRLEDLLCSIPDLLSQLPFLALPAIFCSLLIQIIYIRKETGTMRLMAEQRANLAVVVLEHLQERWPLVVWTTYLLKVLLKDSHATSSLGSAEANHGAVQERSVGRSNIGSVSASNRPSTTPLHMASLRPIQTLPTSGNQAALTSGSQHGIPNSRNDHIAFNPAVDANFSPMPFMMPLNGFLDDAGMDLENWDFGYELLDSS